MNPYPFELLNHFTVPCTSCLLWQVTNCFYSWGGSETNRRHEHELRGVYQTGFPSQYLDDKKYSPLCIFIQKIDLNRFPQPCLKNVR
jgi:hypothetical protein